MAVTTMKNLRHCIAILGTMFVLGNVVSCKKKMECAPNERIPEGVSVVINGKKFTGGPGGCCIKLAGGMDLATDCIVDE